MQEEEEYVHKAIVSFFKEQAPEMWVRRCRGTDSVVGLEPAAKKRAVGDDKPIPSAALSVETKAASLPSPLWAAVASFLDPHDIDILSLVCKTSHAGLSYYTDGGATLNVPAVRVRLQSMFDYFGILKLYADQVHKLYGPHQWVSIAKLFTDVANRMQRRYGRKWRVHPLHRALVAEGILERLYNGKGDEEEVEELPCLMGYAPERNGDLAQHFPVDAAPKDLAVAARKGDNNILQYGSPDESLSAYGESSYAFHHYQDSVDDGEWEDVEGIDGGNDPYDRFVQNWVRHAKEKLAKQLQQTPNDQEEGETYTGAEREAIEEGRYPYVWLFDSTADSNGYEAGMAPRDDGTIAFYSWNYYQGLVEGIYGEDVSYEIPLNGPVHYFLLYPMTSCQGGVTVGNGQALLRLAWLYAHRIAPIYNDTGNTSSSWDWEKCIASVQDEDSDDRGYPIPVPVLHANIRALVNLDKENGGLASIARATDYDIRTAAK